MREGSKESRRMRNETINVKSIGTKSYICVNRRAWFAIVDVVVVDDDDVPFFYLLYHHRVCFFNFIFVNEDSCSRGWFCVCLFNQFLNSCENKCLPILVVM